MTIAGRAVNPQLVWAGGGVLALLIVATVVGLVLRATIGDRDLGGKIHNLNARIRGWWVMFLVFGLMLIVGQTGALVLFGFISFFALREYLSLVATRRADHRVLFWTFFIFTPLQYYLLSIQWLGFFIVIPVYAFLFIPAAMAFRGDSKAFLERAAKIQWGLMLCVYCLSHAPALLLLQINGY
jgi:phosphatidate cytidylyltransferase